MSIFSKLYSKGTEEEEGEQISVRAVQETKVAEATEVAALETVSLEQSVWGTITRWCVYLIALLTPLWFLPLTANPVDGSKLFLVSVLAIMGFIGWLGAAVYMGTLKIPRLQSFYALGVWLLVYLLAAFFSVSPEASFWGSSATSFFYILIGGVVAFLTAVILPTSKETHRTYVFILVAAALSALFMIVQTIFGFDIFPWDFAKQRTFHPVGQWNAIGFFFGFILISLVPFIASSEGVRRLFHVFVLVLSALSLFLAAVVNYRLVWIGIVCVSAVYLAYHYSRMGNHNMRMRHTMVPLLLLLCSVLLYLSQNMIGVFLVSLNPPIDVVPSMTTSLQIAKNTLGERSILGMGPNTFGIAWERFKDPLVNTTIFWRLRFGTASSFALTLLTTTGVLGAIAFLGFIGSVLWMGFILLSKLQWEEEDHRRIAASLFGLLFLLLSWFFYPLTITISILTFLMLGLCAAEASAAGMFRFPVFSIQADSTKGFVVALLIIFLMVFGVVGLYITSQKYVAAILFNRGIEVFNRDGSVNAAENLFRRAVEFDDSQDQYYHAITQMSVIKLQRSLQDNANKPPEDIRSAFQIALSSAITAAGKSTEVNPGNAANWQLLGQVYEAVIPFVGGAAQASLDAYTHAITQSPQDPVLRDDAARVYITLGDYVKARESLEEAIRLKSDYAAAHFRLAQIAAIKGNAKDAITNSERAALAAPNDIGVLFQLGLLYYQENRFNEAKQILDRAVQLNKNYSNARYFLGLSYASLGERVQAIEQFERIRELNPENPEVRVILKNLQAGKDPLIGITPPPLQRDEVPVEKEGEELKQSDVLQKSMGSSAASEE